MSKLRVQDARLNANATRMSGLTLTGCIALRESSTAALGGKRTLARYRSEMRVAALGVSLTALLSLSACASSAVTPVEEITVARRLWFGICTGVCPNYDVTVWSDGRVLAVRHYFETADEAERFQVSRREAAEFRDKLMAYRPANDPSALPVCEHHLSAHEEPLLMKVIEIEVRWAGNRKSRLVACDTGENGKLVEEIRQALWSVHLDLTARRRDREYQRQVGGKLPS